MNTSRSAPASSASSTAYWINGLSTIGSISFGEAFVAGRKRVPRPSTRNTTVRIRAIDPDPERMGYGPMIPNKEKAEGAGKPYSHPPRAGGSFSARRRRIGNEDVALVHLDDAHADPFD